MKNIIKILGIFGVFIFLAWNSRAEIYGASASIEGQVKNVYSDFFTIVAEPDTAKSYDSNQSRIGEFSISVNPLTQYKNVRKITNLAEGDRVKVQYHQEKSRNIANVIDRLGSGTITTKQSKTTTTVTTTTVTTTP